MDRLIFLQSFYLGIIITGNEDIHNIGSSVNIICFSDMAVQTIQWLNNGQELFSNSGQQQLLLQIDCVHLTQMYTCEVMLV